MPTLTRVLHAEQLRTRRPARRTGRWRNRLATARTYSENRKLGVHRMHATYAAQLTCPTTCPFLNNGCYAESGHVGIYMAQPMRRASLGVDPCAVAVEEARCIDALPATRDLRLHVLGDFHCEPCTRLIAAAVDWYLDRSLRSGADRRVRVFSYTHNHTIPRAAFGRISILRSCETPAQVQRAFAEGFGAFVVTTVPLPADGRAMRDPEMTLIPCVFETRGVSCADCGLCLDGDALARRRAAVAVNPHSLGAERVRATVAGLTAPLEVAA